MLTEAIRGRTEASGAPVEDRRHGHAEIPGELVHIEQGLQPSRMAGGESSVFIASRMRRREAISWISMTGSNLTTSKVPETLEFPGLFGRADRI